MKNGLDEQYIDLLQDILDNGVEKRDRTGTGTISVFGRQIRHKMSEGFPLLTTKKMHWNSIVTELLWFLRGDTNIKFLLDNDCHIWDGDAYKNYAAKTSMDVDGQLTKEEFIKEVKTNDEFAKKWGELGPIYGFQWRNWGKRKHDTIGNEHIIGIDQISNLINDLKTNPDSRRLMVNAWNVSDLNHVVLPPCHYGFQVYTRPTTREEKITNPGKYRAISLMWNQRSVDTFLGLPFNIASYGLLLEIIAKMVNMVPDELVGNLGDVHLYANHVEQAKEQIGRDLTLEERFKLAGNQWPPGGLPNQAIHFMNEKGIAKRTREPFPLPTLNINTEFWPTESGECGIGPIDTNAVLKGFDRDSFCKCLLEEDLQLYNYRSHPAIKAPLSN
jgi:thymidylate synthase